MGNPNSKPEDRLRYISKDVNSLRSSLRHSRQNLSRDKKEAIVESLAYQSGEVSSMHGKVKRSKIDDVLKTISATMEEVLKIEPKDLDMGAVESDSFVHMPVSQRRADSAGSLMSQKITNKIGQAQVKQASRNSVPTIREIEAKLDDLKASINTAIDNKDSRQLRVYKTTIEVLGTDLEMIPVEKDTPLEQRKVSLMKKLTHLYQKILKALKELKRENNLQYLSTQSRKEKAVNDLAEVELHLAENESLLDRMAKEKNLIDVATIRYDVVQISQKLAKVDMVDNEVKDKMVILSQKLTEIVKNLDLMMAKKEFASKFTKSLETFERIVRNFNEASNAAATKNNLENLRNSVENLEELNDSSKNRKRELLASINKHIESLEEAVQKESDRQTIQKIVEDNVVLRRNVKSTDKEYTVIDQFINYWNNVKSNFDVNSYSNLSLLRIDGVLEEMQQSINDIRIGIANKCDTYPPTNMFKKQSQSVPKLNVRKSYGSNQSLDQLDSKVTKARAKMYNISTPELLSVQKEEQNYVNNRFSKIEEIKMQVHYIKEKINESHNKNLLREKLENYLQNLAELSKDSNKTVANNAIIVSNDITELLHVSVVTDFKERVDTLIKRVQKFNGTRYDKEFEEIKDDLIKVQITIENFNIPEQYELLRGEKDQILNEVAYNIESLQEKTAFYRKHGDENVKKIKIKVQTLSDKVKRFSGTYKGVLYNQIERDLNKLLLEIGEQIEDKMSSDETTKNVERLLKILEQRASLAQSFKASKSESTKTEDQMGMTKIINDLSNIKKEIDKTPDDNVEAFIGLQSRLDLVNLELSQISARSSENLEKEKEIFSNEAQTLRNIVDAKVALGQQPLVQWPEREMQPDLKNYPKNDVNKEMEKLESKFQTIKHEVNVPNTEEDIHKYYKLAQDIRKLLKKLEQYNFMRGTDLYTRKTNLVNEMQYYLEVLEKEAKDADYVISMEEKVDNIENILNSNQQSDLKTMANELQAIQSKLENHKVSAANEILRERKTSVQQKTDDLALKLKQMADNKAENINKKLRDETKRINDIEEKVKALRPEIINFIGLQSDSKFYELDETSMRLTLVLDKFETDNPGLQKRKIKLLKELHQFGEILDERAQQTQEISDLEQYLEKVSLLINEFSGGEEELRKLKSKLEKLGRRIQSVRVNTDLVSRKNACMEKLSVLFNKVMTLTLSALPPPPPPPEVNSVQKYQDCNQVKTIQSSGLSPMTSSSHTVVTQYNSTGYTTQHFNFVNTKTNNVTNNNNNIVNPNDSRLFQIENEIKQLENFINNTNDADKLQEIDEAFTKYAIELGHLNYSNDSAEFKKKMELFQIIENLTDVIEKKFGDSEVVAKIEREVDEIGNKMNTPLTDEQINDLDEQLIQLQISLGKITNSTVKSQIDACMMKIILYAKNISDNRQSIKNTRV